jgi:hypothetical protein
MAFMGWPRGFIWIAACAGTGTLLAAVVSVLLPLHANGVSGTALTPHYARYWGFTVSAPRELPVNPTFSELRAAGVTFPRDVVTERRHAAAVVAAAGFVLLLVAAGCTLASHRREAD